MKKLFALLTVAGMLFLFGCNSATQQEATEEVVEEKSEIETLKEDKDRVHVPFWQVRW